MDSTPLVSVVLAVYNGERFVAESLWSVLGQTVGNFELIVIDDGSTDRTPEILRQFSDPRMRILRNRSNRGLTPSLNRGLAEARGEFIARQDADDISEPDRLARQLAFLDDHTDVAMTGSWYREIDVEGRVIEDMRLPSDPLRLRWALNFYCPFVHSGAMWRREPVEREIGRYDERFEYAMDYDLWIRIAARFPVANVERHLIRYRLGAHSMTSTNPRSDLEVTELRTREVGRLMGGSVPDRSEWRPRANRLFALLYAREALSDIEAIQRARYDLGIVHEAFARELDLNPDEARDHMKELEWTIARRLVREAWIQRRDGNAIRAHDLYRFGVRFRGRAVLSPPSLRYWTRALLDRPGSDRV
jgi:glycosyltransferase involved in cell wall biosynthesis